MPYSPKKVLRPAKPGTIYFVTDGSGYVKIGHTSGSVNDRITTLQVANPRTLELIAAIACEDVRVVERHIHLRFQDRWHMGEWFRVSKREVMHCVRVYEHNKRQKTMAFAS
jgi:hypothetical protein